MREAPRQAPGEIVITTRWQGEPDRILVEVADNGSGIDSWSELEAVVNATVAQHTARIATFLPHPGFPVDIRHNAKIGRETLAAWAAAQKEPHA